MTAICAASVYEPTYTTARTKGRRNRPMWLHRLLREGSIGLLFILPHIL